MIADPTEEPESAYETAQIYLLQKIGVFGAEHQRFLRQKGGYERAKASRLLMEVMALGRKRIALLAEADEVMRRDKRRK